MGGVAELWCVVFLENFFVGQAAELIEAQQHILWKWLILWFYRVVARIFLVSWQSHLGF